MIGFDADQDCSHVAAPAYAKGVRFICRYLKNLSLAEVHAISNAGPKIVTIWETTAQRALGGALAGTVDGRVAYSLCASLNQPAGSAVYATIDFDATAEQQAIVLSYLQAFKVCVAPYKLGVYANGAICQAALDAKIVAFAWLMGGLAMRGSKEFLASGNASIVQDVGDKHGLDLGIDIDTDMAIDGDTGEWALPAIVPPVKHYPTAIPPVRDLQAALGVEADGDWGPLSAAALAAHYRDHP